MPPGEKGLFLQTSEKRTEVQKAEVLQKGEKISPFSETWLCKERVLEQSRACAEAFQNRVDYHCPGTTQIN
jgi:hypothetical protein